ncbi:SIR2 family protein [Agrobacterium salinitolerans]|uniref:SIR2 family protein n=1 Tax=Agrobacterium salinitolerans TaxID=1183413 RepID=UPI001C22A6A3|nr:SIR2 family protein [Agrobacterium salinitolerans]QXC52014.1 SIR2 family protein [Agrobacterium salinitolerans]
MDDYWTGKSGNAKHLRLLTKSEEWLAWEDKDADPSDPSSARIAGARSRVEEALLQSIHSTNLVVLLGSGASFCAKNATGAAAPSMAGLWHAVRENASEGDILGGYDDFDDIVRDVTGKSPVKTPDGKVIAGDIEALLSLCKMKLELMNVSARDEEKIDPKGAILKLTDFIEKAEKTILRQVDFVNGETELTAHKGLVQKLAKRAVEKPRVKLFTTNYDLCLEEASSRLGVILVDGFSHSAEQRFNRDHFHHDIVRRPTSGTKADYIDGVFHLYKLHGSVDWRRRPDGIVIRSRSTDAKTLKPVLIYPRSTKYQEAFETPYLDMFAALQAALREPDTTVIVSGFGFADDHISSPIWSALESNLGLRFIMVDPSYIPAKELDAIDPDHLMKAKIGGQKPYQKKIMRLVQEGDPRITVLNGRFEDLVDAIPAITGETDRQRLEIRLDNIRGVAP